MGCVGLIRIICRISRTLFPRTISQRETENASRIGSPPSSFPCSHFYLHYDNSSPAKLFSFPSRTVFRSPTSLRVPTERSGLCFCINMIFLPPRAGVPPVPPLENRAAPPEPPRPYRGIGRWAREAPNPAPAGKYSAGEGCQARAGAPKHSRKHSFCLEFSVLYEIRVLPSLS